MTHPVPGARMSNDYGTPGNYAAGIHTGRDYAADQGTPVLATRAGVVVFAGWAGDYGNQIIVDHGNGVQSLYNHLSAFAIKYGQVGEGQHIGDVGTSGNSTGPHLHYEERTSPYGYYDHRRPEYDTSTGSEDPGGDDDMTPEQVQVLNEIHWMLGQVKGQTDHISPRLMSPIDTTAYVVESQVKPETDKIADILARLDAIERKLG